MEFKKYEKDGDTHKALSIDKGVFDVNLTKKTLDFRYALPKVPVGVLDTIITIFREDLSVEHALAIYYDKQKEEFFIHVPHLTVQTKVNVNYDYMEATILDAKYQHVLDVHSHNTMDAFFSAQDDAAEIRAGIYMVIGKLEQTKPAIVLRVGYQGVFKELFLCQIFC